MPDNKNKHAFDNDILQCKADILKALGTSGQEPGPTLPPAVQPEKKDEVSIDDSVLELDLSDTDSVETPKITTSGESSADNVPPVQILPFELLSKRPSLPAANENEINQQTAEPQPAAAIIPEPASETPAEISEDISIEEEAENIIDDFSISEDDLIDISNIDSEEVVHENGVLKKTLEQLEKQNSQYHQEREQITAQLKQLSESMEPLRKTNEQLELRLDELTKKAQAAEKESNQVEQGLLKSIEEEKTWHANTRQQLQSMEAELQKVRKARDFLSESFSSVSEQNQQLQSELEKIKHEKSGSSEITEQQAQEILILHKQLNEQTAMLKEQKDSMQSQEKELGALCSQNNLLREELSKIETAHSQSEAEIRRLQAEIRQLKEDISSAEQQVKELQETSSQSQTNEELLRQEAQTVQTLFTKYREQTEQELSEHSHRIDTLKGQIHVLELKRREYQSEADRQREQMDVIAEEKEQVQNELNLQLQKHAVLSSDFARLEKQLADKDNEHKSEVEALTAANNRLVDERQNLHSELEQMRDQLQQLKEELSLSRKTSQQPTVQSVLDDKKLEVTLHPEELNALMDFDPQDEEIEQSEPIIVNNIEPANQTNTDSNMPAFSLADLIMSEHRRSASGRRHKIEPGGHAEHSGVRRVVEQYIKPAANIQEARKTSGSRMWDDDLLTPFQRELLHELIEKDIKRLGDTTSDRHK